MPKFDTKVVGKQVDAFAPDGSEIRLLPTLSGGSMAHCRLPVGMVTQAVQHPRVEEIWYVLSGKGEIWRKQATDEAITSLETGVSVTIPVGTIFQFRNIGNVPLDIILMTMPPWAGPEDAIKEENHWER